MEANELKRKSVTQISGRIFLSSMLIFCISALIGIPLQILGLQWKWLEILGSIFLLFAFVLLGISWITPGILLILGVPWFTHAWLRGINPWAIWNKPWEELSDIQKVLIYFWAILFSGFTLLAVVAFTIQNVRK